jgi:hypothetical protein
MTPALSQNQTKNGISRRSISVAPISCGCVFIPVEFEEALDPFTTGLLGAQRVVETAQNLPNFLQQLKSRDRLEFLLAFPESLFNIRINGK